MATSLTRIYAIIVNTNIIGNRLESLTSLSRLLSLKYLAIFDPSIAAPFVLPVLIFNPLFPYFFMDTFIKIPERVNQQKTKLNALLSVIYSLLKIKSINPG